MEKKVNEKIVKILLIEDDAEAAQNLRLRLSYEKESTYQVESCTTLHAGLERLKNENFDVVLLDLSLPDSCGLDTFDTLYRLAPNVPTVVLTSFADQSFAVETLRKGACDYLIKGEIDYRMMPRVIRYAIERCKIINELNLANARLQSLALVDPLTGTLNRKGLQDALSREIQWSQREGSNLLVFHAGLDDFKQINQTLGHATGDIILKEVSQKLMASLRTTDYIGRIGGDEFLMLLPRTRLAEGLRVAERVRLAISQSPISILGGNPVVVTGSLAIAVVTEGTLSIDELLAKTRMTLHQSKRNGKNKVIFEPLQNGHFDKDNNAVSQIFKALHGGNHHHVVVLPVYDLTDHTKVGYEFLSRMSIEGFEVAEDFFRFCLEHNILTLVDHRCFEACLSAGAVFPPEMRRHVNLFPSTLINIPVEHLIKALPENYLERSLCVEISEQQIIGDPSYLIKPVVTLKEAGILVAIDDVGFGRSCLESLVLLEPDVIKIDKKCVMGISRDESRAAALKRILKVANSLGTEVIAEGIETEEDLNVIKQLGVRLGQGFLWGKPVEIHRLNPSGLKKPIRKNGLKI